MIDLHNPQGFWLNQKFPIISSGLPQRLYLVWFRFNLLLGCGGDGLGVTATRNLYTPKSIDSIRRVIIKQSKRSIIFFYFSSFQRVHPCELIETDDYKCVDFERSSTPIVGHQQLRLKGIRLVGGDCLDQKHVKENERRKRHSNVLIFICFSPVFRA